MLKFLFFLFCFCFSADCKLTHSYAENIKLRLKCLTKMINQSTTPSSSFCRSRKDETRGKQFVREENDLSKFSVEYFEGQSISEFHKLIVSADGYKTAENEIKFITCNRLLIQVKLPKNDSAEIPVWNFENSVTLSTEDENGKEINGVKISVIKDGKVIEEKDSKYYGIGFEIKNGEYIFRFEKDGYQTKEIKADLTKIGDLKITVKLKLKK